MSRRIRLWGSAGFSSCCAVWARRLSVYLFTAILVASAGASPNWAQDLPKGVNGLIDKTKTGKNQGKTADGKPTMGLQGPACDSEECKKLWSEIRDTLEIWYAYQDNLQLNTEQLNKLMDNLGVDKAGYGDIKSKKNKLKGSDPNHFGNKDKVEQYLKELTDKYGKCGKPCEKKAAENNNPPEHCIIVLQYDETDKSIENAIATNTAYNKDFVGGAHALAAKLKLDPSKIKVVGPNGDLISAIQSYAKEGICCKTISIFGHGTPASGALLLPYSMTDGPSGVANNTLGGNTEINSNSATRKEYAKKKLEELKNAIKNSCPDPKRTVSFYSCFVGETNGLAKQLAELGVSTEGFSGSCTFPYDKKTDEYLLPEGKNGAEIQKFPAVGGGGGEFKKPDKNRRREPGQTFGETISRVITGTDGETWCSYGDGVGFETVMIATDENGDEIETTESEETTSETETEIETEIETGESQSAQGETRGSMNVTEATPATPAMAEAVPEKPTTPETPPTTEQVPEEPATPETPTTTEKPEEPTTPETPTTTEKREEPTTPETPTTTEKPEEPTSEIPDTIFVKAREEVLEGKPAGEPIENQVVKLFPAEEPALPGTGETREAEDTGFDKDPVECMTGAGGDCAMQIPADDRQAYDLPGTGEEPGKNYRLDYDLPKDSGGVAETTGKPAEPDVKSGTPAGANVASEVFSIGERTFTRLVYEQAYGLDHDFDEQFKPVFGESYEEDFCRDKQPGPPLGMQPSTFGALNHDLPEATIKFGAATPAHGDAP